MITLGNTEITKAYLGNTEISEMYLGEDLVFGDTTPKPYDAKVSYLDFTGTQYINTLFTPDSNSYISIVASMSDRNTFLCGAGQSYNNRAFEMYTYNATSVEVNYGNKYATGALLYTSGTFSKFVLDKNIATSYDMQGNTTRTHTFDANTFTCPSTLYIGALHRGANGQTTNISTKAFKLGEVVIKDNDTLVRDFIPVRVGQVGYLYDKVSGELFGNSGSGTIGYGNN